MTSPSRRKHPITRHSLPPIRETGSNTGWMAAGTLLVALLGAGQPLAADEPGPAEARPRWQSARQRPVALRRSYTAARSEPDVDDASFTDSGRRLHWKQSTQPQVRWTSPSRAEPAAEADRPAGNPGQRPRPAIMKGSAKPKTVLRLQASEPASPGPRLTQLEDLLMPNEESVMQDSAESIPDAGAPLDDTLPAPEDPLEEPPADDSLPETFLQREPTSPLDVPDRRDGPTLTPEEECSRGLEAIQESVIRNIDLNIAVTGSPGSELPYECSLDDEAFAGRFWAETLYTWKSSSLCHKPLYFEELALERYGHSKGPYVQPLYSAAHFFASLPALPYLMGLRPPKECVYALGHYRPGSCAPYLKYPIPISTRAALFQAGAVVGTAAVLP